MAEEASRARRREARQQAADKERLRRAGEIRDLDATLDETFGSGFAERRREALSAMGDASIGLPPELWRDPSRRRGSDGAIVWSNPLITTETATEATADASGGEALPSEESADRSGRPSRRAMLEAAFEPPRGLRAANVSLSCETGAPCCRGVVQPRRRVRAVVIAAGGGRALSRSHVASLSLVLSHDGRSGDSHSRRVLPGRMGDAQRAANAGSGRARWVLPLSANATTSSVSICRESGALALNGLKLWLLHSLT